MATAEDGLAARIHEQSSSHVLGKHEGSSSALQSPGEALKSVLGDTVGDLESGRTTPAARKRSAVDVSKDKLAAFGSVTVVSALIATLAFTNLSQGPAGMPYLGHEDSNRTLAHIALALNALTLAISFASIALRGSY
jgi:hypothetical protein